MMKHLHPNGPWPSPWRATTFFRAFATLLVAGLLAPAGGHSQTLEPDQLFEKLAPSVWVVTTFDDAEKRLAQGSAVAISPGTLVTNCHVLAKAKSFVVKRDNVAYGATLQYADAERDLCQIQVRNFTAPSVDIAATSALRVGQRVYAVGNPRGLELTFSDGLISGLRRTDDGQSVELVQTTAPISPGSSGGGLFDAQGRLIGITSATRRDSQNLNFAMPGDWIKEIPERSRLALEKREAAKLRLAPSGQPVTKKGAYFVGQTLQYAIVDHYTGQRQPVQLRVDSFDGNNIVFNSGQRVEGPTGRIVKGDTRMLSELDSINATGGWVHGDTASGSWSIESLATEQQFVRFEAQGQFVGESRQKLPAGEFDVRMFRFNGYRHNAAPQAGAVSQATLFEATAWFAPSLMRVVRFTIRSVSGYYRMNEEVVLERLGQ
jgi:S1-C subfamily serine protease